MDPLLTQAADDLVGSHIGGAIPPVIAIAGAQGSGKTTLARDLARRWNGVQLSLDDVYLDQPERRRLAQTVHPLLTTRGPPLTHDLDLLAATCDALRAAGAADQTPLPAFEKLTDRRRSRADRPVFRGRPRVIVVDGWCLGARPQADIALETPINAVERVQDPDGVWRRAVNAALAGPYQHTFARFDAVLFIAAPSFDIVADWRCQQEVELLGLEPDALPAEARDRIGWFIQVFERISRSMLEGGVEADVVVSLDPDRRVRAVTPGSRSPR